MRFWITEILAVDPSDGELKRWFGPNVPGINRPMAEDYCQKNELGYCLVVRELISETPYKDDTDWSKQVNYENLN
jgi:hypothetical protein